MIRILPLLSLLSAALLSAPASAQNSSVMSYGDTIGTVVTLEVHGMAPGTSAYLIPAFSQNGSNYLVGLSGDANDMLGIDLQLAMGGTYFTGNVPGSGVWTVNIPLPASTAYVDRAVNWQAFSRHQAAGADMFQNFSPVRVMTMNTGNRWQACSTRFPMASSNLSYAVTAKGPDGNPTELFICGGGPLLLTDNSNPYPTIDRAWTYDAIGETHIVHNGVMNQSRAFHNTVQLSDGRVLVAGGIQGPYGSGANHYTKVLRSAEIFDPTTDTWTQVADMNKFRAGATALLLPDGRVLVAGGTEGNGNHNVTDVADLLGTALKTSEIYNPSTDSWSWGPNMHEPKAGATGLSLPDGRWAVIGGITYTTFLGIPIPDFSEVISVYDPTANAFNSQATLKDKRGLGAATVMQNGQVFIAGGAGGDIFNIGPIRKTEIWNPSNNSTARQDDLTTNVAFSGCVTLPSGLVVIVGGATGDLDDPIPVNKTWAFNPSTGNITALANMPEDHAGGVVSLLEDGTIYCGGGESNSGQAVREVITYTP